MGCYNDKVLFIHIPKCAGWSVKTYLYQHLPNVLMPKDPAAKLPIGHVRLQDIERFTGRAPESFELILAVIRDPYEQQLSQWCFWRDRFARGQRHLHDWVAGAYADLTAFLADPRCDFHVWYQQHFGFEAGQTPEQQQEARKYMPAQEGCNRYQDFGGCYQFWLTVNGVIPKNVTILRQETLTERLPEVVGPFANKTLGPVPQLNQSEHKHDVREYYTPKGAALVEAKFQWAFENHYEKWLWSSFATR